MDGTNSKINRQILERMMFFKKKFIIVKIYKNHNNLFNFRLKISKKNIEYH